MYLLWRIPHTSSFVCAQRHNVSCSICKFDCDLIIYRLTHVARGLSRLWIVCGPLPVLSCPAVPLCFSVRPAVWRFLVANSLCPNVRTNSYTAAFCCYVRCIWLNAAHLHTHSTLIFSLLPRVFDSCEKFHCSFFFLHAISNYSLCSCWHCRWQYDAAVIRRGSTKGLLWQYNKRASYTSH